MDTCDGKLPCPGSAESDEEIRDAVLALCDLTPSTIPADYAAWQAACTKGESAWIALTDRDLEASKVGNDFKWLDACDAAPLADPGSFKNWLLDQPNDFNDQDCVGWIHGGWGDWYCEGGGGRGEVTTCFCQADVTTTTTVVEVVDPCGPCCNNRRNLRFGMDECAECTCL